MILHFLPFLFSYWINYPDSQDLQYLRFSFLNWYGHTKSLASIIQYIEWVSFHLVRCFKKYCNISCIENSSNYFKKIKFSVTPLFWICTALWDFIPEWNIPAIWKFFSNLMYYDFKDVVKIICQNAQRFQTCLTASNLFIQGVFHSSYRCCIPSYIFYYIAMRWVEPVPWKENRLEHGHMLQLDLFIQLLLMLLGIFGLSSLLLI